MSLCNLWNHAFGASCHLLAGHTCAHQAISPRHGVVTWPRPTWLTNTTNSTRKDQP